MSDPSPSSGDDFPWPINKLKHFPPIRYVLYFCYGPPKLSEKQLDMLDLKSIRFRLIPTNIKMKTCHGLADLPRNSRTEEMCQYYVYTRNNPLTPQTVLAQEHSLRMSSIALYRTTVILVHGHGGSAFTSLNPDVRNALLTAEDVNVISVDWSQHASLSYSVAVVLVPSVAQSLQNFIHMMVYSRVATLENIHIVGFNLGAHVAGITGRSLIQRVARITGLDPSGSQWGARSSRLRLTDARYVEVIHTDGDGPGSNGLGEAIGHVDFFVNGGRSQPGCFSYECSHNRAYEVFAASMINPNLVGYPCSSSLQLTLDRCRGLPLVMGTNQLSKIGSGIYRINTRRSFPF